VDQSLRVLVVDDHDLVAQGMSMLLDAEDDITVVGRAGNVADAVAQAERFQPDVVLIDYRLPDGTGVSAAELIRDVVSDVELVLITAAVEPAAVQGALEAGFAGFVGKEASSGELITAVRAAGAGEVHFSSVVLDMVLRARRKPVARLPELSSREVEVLQLIAVGNSTSEVAGRLYLSQHTVRNHVRNILQKLGAHSKLEAVVIASRQGLVHLTN
jgi:DNA-binding NarL/FixJ family response regulator